MRTAMIALAAFGLGLAGCATTPKVVTDFDRQQDFTAYRTFAWADDNPMAVFGSRIIPPTIGPRIASSVRAQLEAKGYRFVDDVTKADFAVSFTVGTRDGTNIVETPDYFWANSRNWRWGAGYYPVSPVMAVPVTRTEVTQYTEGTLAIDIYDVARKSPVWHGASSKNLSRSQLEGKNPNLEQAVTNILAGFPPG